MPLPEVDARLTYLLPIRQSLRPRLDHFLWRLICELPHILDKPRRQLFILLAMLIFARLGRDGQFFVHDQIHDGQSRYFEPR
jgi:hypothetical protein